MIRRIAITGGLEKSGSKESLQRFLAALSEHQIEVSCCSQAAAAFDMESAGELAEIVSSVDMIVTIGGDGSMLRAASKMRCLNVPLLGINSGRLGFLSFATNGEEAQVAAALAKGEYELSFRSLLEVKVRNLSTGKLQDTSYRALNEVTITRGAIARMILLRASVDGRILTDYHADGLIVATPTGSSAYSLAAGGPVLTPQAPVILLTPICPHALSSRPIVLSESALIELRMLEGNRAGDVVFTIDGQDSVQLNPDEELVLKQSVEKLPLVMPQGWSFTDKLRHKLGWQNSHIHVPE